MTFLPNDYEIPEKKGAYMRFAQGANRIRILGSAIIGWEGWKDKKPVRKRVGESILMDEIDDETNVKHFWAFPVYNYQEEQIQILEVTQKGIQKAIKALTSDKDWGDPKGYDIVITRTGEQLETEYSIQPKPAKPLDDGIEQTYKDMNINLEALFSGGDPFNSEEEVNIDDIPENL